MANARIEMTNAAIARMLIAESASASAAGSDWEITAELIAGAGRLTSGWVCCILTVARGKGCLALSAGSVMRAVSFFGAAARGAPSGEGVGPALSGAGLSGTVGFAPRDGGLGGIGAPPGLIEGREGAPGGVGALPGGGGTKRREGAGGIGAEGGGGIDPGGLGSDEPVGSV
ncbi:MAG: hypothetical protein JWL90_3867 [Chthoniobacteraceae bacterium]|nr:hypothetical protein [Chthoniobacteraceae bacterium]